MQMLNICVCHAYADVRDMQIPITLFFIKDPEKNRTGSFAFGGDFLRRPLPIVVQSAASATTYSHLAAGVPGQGGLCPVPPPCYASGKISIEEKVGSQCNERQVIYKSVYIICYNNCANDFLK